MRPYYPGIGVILVVLLLLALLVSPYGFAVLAAVLLTLLILWVGGVRY